MKDPIDVFFEVFTLRAQKARMIPNMKPDFLSGKVNPYFVTEAETCYNSG